MLPQENLDFTSFEIVSGGVLGVNGQELHERSWNFETLAKMEGTALHPRTATASQSKRVESALSEGVVQLPHALRREGGERAPSPPWIRPSLVNQT